MFLIASLFDFFSQLPDLISVDDEEPATSNQLELLVFLFNLLILGKSLELTTKMKEMY